MFGMKVEFPGLGIELEVDRVFREIAGFEIMWYAVFIVTGIIIAVLYAMFNIKKFDLDRDKFLDVIILGLVLGVVGARTYYVLFNLSEYHSIADVLNVRGGGLAIYGGVIGAALAGVIGKYWKKLSLLSMLDVTAVGFLVAQALGRWGNFTNQEAFGSATDLPWGMLSENTLKEVPGSPVHPCFLYESLWCIAGFVMLLIMVGKFYKFRGQIAFSYMFWYGLGRAWIEGLRTDSLYLIPDVLRVSQLLAILCVIAAPVLLYLGFSERMFDRVSPDFKTVSLADYKAAKAEYYAELGNAEEENTENEETSEEVKEDNNGSDN